MYVYKFFRWCDAATRKIKYRPDRNAVKNELYEHLEERFESFVEQGLSEEEAGDKAIEVMGSADELAEQLGKIHSPFWLYMLCFSRVALVVLLIISLPLLRKILPSHGVTAQTEPTIGNYQPLPVLQPFSDETFEFGNRYSRRLALFEPKSSGSILPVSSAAVKAAIWNTGQFDPYPYNPNWYNEFKTLFVQIQTTTAEELNSSSGVNFVHAEDSLGNYYYSSIESCHEYSSNNGIAYWNFMPFVDGKYCGEGVYEFAFVNYVSQNAEWIELHYDRDGRNYVMRIDLSGGKY